MSIAITRRGVFFATLASTVLLVSISAGAAPRPHIVDAAGDWPSPSQDIVSVTFSTTLDSRRVSRLSARMELVGDATDTTSGVTYAYVSWFANGCQYWFDHYPDGTGPGQRVELLVVWCEKAGYYAERPADVRSVGRTVTWSAPLALGLRRGSVLSVPTAGAWLWPAARFDHPRLSVYAATYVPGDRTRAGRNYVIGERE